ncbi:MAG: hypothetical protein K8F54_11720 [Altibacter sp.]|uniref:hypothetical protein n=1 Tax=Altibacter sp. TaxID=2024823 RepID=UPI001E13C129|nr:hypothetical protein [Altibacter sp.]MBZ0328267.1 hypothetical protein [Altibacter sp.]
MRKLIFILFTIPLFFFIGCNKKEKNIQKPSEELIAIYVQNQKYDFQDIIILGKVIGDSIEKITDWDDNKADYVVNRKPYLEKYSKYFINQDKVVQQITIDEIISKDFQCSPLTVGHSNKFHLSIKNEFSLATNDSNFKNLLNDNIINLDSKSLNIVKSKLLNAFKDKEIDITSGFDNNFNEVYKPLDIDILQSVDLNGDSVEEVLVKATVGNIYERNTVLLVFNITEDYIKEVGEIDSWSNGYNLIGVTDFNNNGIYELVFQGVGYESIGFEIYEIQDNGFKRLLNTVPYGC